MDRVRPVTTDLATVHAPGQRMAHWALAQTLATAGTVWRSLNMPIIQRKPPPVARMSSSFSCGLGASDLFPSGDLAAVFFSLDRTRELVWSWKVFRLTRHK